MPEQRLTKKSIAALLVLMAAGCGGGGGPTPSPSPTITPTATPTTTPTTTPTPTGQLPAGGVIGDQLEGSAFCVRGTLVYNQPSNASPGLAGLSGLNMAELVRPTTITLRGVDSYMVGFEGPELRPENKIAPETQFFDQFYLAGASPVELDIYRNTGAVVLERAALGFYADGSSFCPFALGAPPSNLPASGTATYSGIADGVAIAGGQTRRLFGSSATLTIDHATGGGTVSIDLASFGDPFGMFNATVGQEFDFAPVTATISGANGAFSGTLRNASGDLTGPLSGNLFASGAPAAGVGFVLNGPDGIRVVGAAAFRRN